MELEIIINTDGRERKKILTGIGKVAKDLKLITNKYQEMYNILTNVKKLPEPKSFYYAETEDGYKYYLHKVKIAGEPGVCKSIW